MTMSKETRVKVSAKAVKLYAEGYSIRQISNELKRSYGFIHRVLTENDVTLRSRGGNTRKPTRT